MNFSDLTSDHVHDIMENTIKTLGNTSIHAVFTTSPLNPERETKMVGDMLYVKHGNKWISIVVYECLNILHIDLNTVLLSSYLPPEHVVKSFHMCVRGELRQQSRLVEIIEHHVLRVLKKHKEPSNPAKFKEVI